MTAEAVTQAPVPGSVRLAGRLAALPLVRAMALAFVFGLLAALALPPVYAIPLLWPAFTGLVWLLDGAPGARRSFAVGWAFGFGFFIAGLYWVGIAVLVDAARFWWFLPIAVAGLPAGLALITGLFLSLARWVAWRGMARPVALAMAWLASEWVRSWLFTGFPWNMIGTVWVASDAMIQVAALAGPWGLSLVTVAAAAAPATLGRAGGASTRWGLPLAMAAVLVAIWAGGALRLDQAPARGGDRVPGITLRLVQPAIEQHLKWQGDLRQKHLRDQLLLSRSEGFGDVSHVIWSEMAFTFPIEGAGDRLPPLSAATPRDGLVITGLPRTGPAARTAPEIWNSLAAVSPAGEVLATYDKEHLVPFGEYIPLRWLLPIAKLTHGRRDFSRGPGRQTLSLPGLPPVSPLICYEVIFAGNVADAAMRPGWLLNLTNDAWFGQSSGPYQHFASARLRAVEEGLPLVRVANSGISGVVDAYGRVVEALPLGARGIVDSGLPRALPEPTTFARFPDLALVVLFLAAGVLTLVLFRRS